MFKKGLLLFMLLGFIGTMQACDTIRGRGAMIDLTENLIDHNVNEMNYIEPNEILEVEVLNFGVLDIIASYPTRGVFFVENAAGEKGVFSSYENGLIVPLAEDVMLTLLFDGVFRGYIAVYHTVDETTTVYDINGNVVISAEDYASATVTGYTENVFDDFGNLVETLYYERVETLLQSDVDEGITTPTIRHYQVDVEAKTRTLTTDTPTYERGDFYDEERFAKMDLEEIGLEGYYAKYIDNTFHVFKEEDDSRVASILVPSGAMVNAINLFDGHIFYQTIHMLSNFDTEYSFIDGGNKFALKTAKIDLLTGEETLLEIDYVIDSIGQFYDEDEIIAYGRIRMNRIDTNVLARDMMYDVVIDQDGDVVLDLSGLSFNNLRRLDDDTLYNTNTRITFDNELNPLFEVPTGQTMVYEEQSIMFTHDGQRGVTNYRGMVQIPFIYDWLSTNFYQGITYGRDADNNWFLIALDGDVTSLKSTVEFITTGLLLNFENELNPITNLYDVDIIEYDGHIHHTLNLANTAYNPNNNFNPYYNEIVVQLTGEDGPIWVSIRLGE